MLSLFQSTILQDHIKTMPIIVKKYETKNDKTMKLEKIYKKILKT